MRTDQRLTVSLHMEDGGMLWCVWLGVGCVWPGRGDSVSGQGGWSHPLGGRPPHPGRQTPPPRGQNGKRLWKYNFPCFATQCRSVNSLKFDAQFNLYSYLTASQLKLHTQPWDPSASYSQVPPNWQLDSSHTSTPDPSSVWRDTVPTTVILSNSRAREIGRNLVLNFIHQPDRDLPFLSLDTLTKGF